MSPENDKRTKYGTLRNRQVAGPPYRVVFYRSGSGREPVRDWLRQLDLQSRRQIGGDLYTLQLGWPVGMPLARKLEPGLWELRSHAPPGIVRILFTAEHKTLVLLHGFVKKSRKLPQDELALAKRRLSRLAALRK